jgi:hypothetical protein
VAQGEGPQFKPQYLKKKKSGGGSGARGYHWLSGMGEEYTGGVCLKHPRLVLDCGKVQPKCPLAVQEPVRGTQRKSLASWGEATLTSKQKCRAGEPWRTNLLVSQGSQQYEVPGVSTWERKTEFPCLLQ